MGNVNISKDYPQYLVGLLEYLICRYLKIVLYESLVAQTAEKIGNEATEGATASQDFLPFRITNFRCSNFKIPCKF